MFNKRRNHEGKRAIFLIRVSTTGQEGGGDKEQLQVVNLFAEQNKIEHVKTTFSIGVSGSDTFNRTDIEKLLAEKREHNSYDVLLVHDLSRLTRGGVDHGSTVIRDFQRVGVEVISVMENIPDGPEGELFRAVINYSNSSMPRHLAFKTTTGRMISRKEKRRTHCSLPPYGVDRLITDNSGEPVEIIQYRHGDRFILDPRTLDIREVHRRNPKGRLVLKTKLRDQKSTHIPGRPETVALVNWIWEQHYGDGLGATRIAEIINTQRTERSMKGRNWSASNVHNILRNPIYLGYSDSGRLQCGKFQSLGESEPVPTNVDQRLLEGTGLKKIPGKRLDKSKWVTVDYPQLVTFIKNEDVRKAGALRIVQYWEGWALRAGSNPLKGAIVRRNRHRNTIYILRDVIKVKGEEHEFRGSGRGNYNEKPDKRTYMVRQALELFPRGDKHRRQFPADTLERAVLGVLKDAFTDSALINQLASEFVKAELRKLGEYTDQNDKVGKTLESRRKKLSKLIDMGDVLDADQWADAVRKEREEIGKMEQQILSAPNKPKLNEQEIASLTAGDLFNCEIPVPKLRREEMRLLINDMIRIEIDLESAEAFIEVRMPSFVTSGCGVKSTHVLTHGFSPHWANQPLIAKYQCFLPLKKDGTQRTTFSGGGKGPRPTYSWKRLPREHHPTRTV